MFLVSLFSYFCSHECNTSVQKGLQFLGLPKFALAYGTSGNTGHRPFLYHIYRGLLKNSYFLLDWWLGVVIETTGSIQIILLFLF